MGFDNECIVNIQSLAGEYFCPVCRLLVYPNEALQSQCTHLYCKPCLTYVVGTTRACPYDGYLVTEPDSKPLLESNKALAETIGKIAVRCLFHRSGCPWQGPLSYSVTHCACCSYGNSAVICNQCAVQIVHRQVQEHAQTCPGVQPQATQVESTQNLAATAAAVPANGGQPQTATQSGDTNSVANTPQTAVAPTTVQGPSLQASLNPQAHAVAPGAVPTPEQLYQQQYYQQYPGYDPYQQAYQNYYPYGQQAQVYLQPQQLQQQPIPSQTSAQAPPQAQTQTQAQTQFFQNVNPYQAQAQMIPQGHQPSQAYPYPYPQMQSYHGGQPQQQPPPTQPPSQQIPQFPQPQMPPQPHPQAHPQHQNIPQQQQQTQVHPVQRSMNQAPNPNAQPQTQPPVTNAVTGNHTYAQPQANYKMQMGAQQRPNMHPQGGPIPQQPPLPQGQYPQQFPPMGTPQSHPPGATQQLPPHGQVAGFPSSQQRPVNPYAQHPGMQPMQQAMNQQHMPHQHAFSGQASGPVQNQLHPHGQQMQLPPSPSMHPPSQSYPARPVMPNHGAQPQAFAQSPAGYPGQAQGRPPHLGANQHFPTHNHQFQRNESPAQKSFEKEPNGLATESVEAKNMKVGRDVKLGGNEHTGSELQRAQSTNFLDTSATEKKGDESQKEKSTLSDGSKEGGAHTGVQAFSGSEGSAKLDEQKSGQSNGQVFGSGAAPPMHQFPPAEQFGGPHFPMQYPSTQQQRPAGHPMSQPALPPGVPNHAQAPGQPHNMLRPQGPDQLPPFGRPPSHFVPHDRNFELQHSGDPRKPSGPFNTSVSKPVDKEPFGLTSDAVGAPRFLPPYQTGGLNEVGKRVPQVGHGGNTGRGIFSLTRPDFHGPVPGFGGHHMDRFSSKSPGRENAGFQSREFGGLPGFPRDQSGFGNFEGRESRPFDGGPRPFGHFQRGELEGPRFMRDGEFQGSRGLFNGNGPRRGDLSAPDNFPHHTPFSEQYGGNILDHPNFGDRGFRSSYPTAGGLDPFDSSSRKRLRPNNGWCRICKIDCEGVEGLELHAQTRKHQDMAMDMVRSIKLQNGKKQKTANERPSLEDSSKRRGPGYEVQSTKS